MKRKGTIAAVAFIAVQATVVSTHFALASPTYGTGPYNAVVAAASAAKKCGLSTNKLAAAMMAVTFNESGRQSAGYAPGPGILGRYDTKSNLYIGRRYSPPVSPSTINTRVFWHPGVGLFQLDDSGLGTSSSYEKFSSSGSAPIVARLMASRYCTYHTVSSMWGATWYGCSHPIGACTTYFNELYNSSNDTLRKTLVTVADAGGNLTHTCTYANGSVTFTCVFARTNAINPCNGFCGNLSGGNGMNPLALPFYVYRTGSTTKYEVRVWMPQDTGAPTDQYYFYVAARTFGNDSRSSTGLKLYRASSSYELCDITIRKGTCPQWVYKQLPP